MGRKPTGRYRWRQRRKRPSASDPMHTVTAEQIHLVGQLARAHDTLVQLKEGMLRADLPEAPGRGIATLPFTPGLAQRLSPRPSSSGMRSASFRQKLPTISPRLYASRSTLRPPSHPGVLLNDPTQEAFVLIRAHRAVGRALVRVAVEFIDNVDKRSNMKPMDPWAPYFRFWNHSGQLLACSWSPGRSFI